MEYVRYFVNRRYQQQLLDEGIDHEYMRIYQAMAYAEDFDFTSCDILSCYKQEELALEVV